MVGGAGFAANWDGGTTAWAAGVGESVGDDGAEAELLGLWIDSGAGVGCAAGGFGTGLGFNATGGGVLWPK